MFSYFGSAKFWNIQLATLVVSSRKLGKWTIASGRCFTDGTNHVGRSFIWDGSRREPGSYLSQCKRIASDKLSNFRCSETGRLSVSNYFGIVSWYVDSKY